MGRMMQRRRPRGRPKRTFMVVGEDIKLISARKKGAKEEGRWIELIPSLKGTAKSSRIIIRS